MQFIKKTVILSGSGSAGGTVALEQNAFGVSATLNVFNLPDLDKGEYILGFKWDTGIFKRKVGALGRISTRFSLAGGVEFKKLHCVLYCADKPLLYGVLEGERLWAANLMDGFKEEEYDTQESAQPQGAEKAQDVTGGIVAKAAAQKITERPEAGEREGLYSTRKDIGEFFFDILPKDKRLSVTDYEDGRIAEVNYYPEQLSRTVYPELEKFVVREGEEAPLYSGPERQREASERPPAPAERMKKFLYRYRHAEAACTAQAQEQALPPQASLAVSAKPDPATGSAQRTPQKESTGAPRPAENGFIKSEPPRKTFGFGGSEPYANAREAQRLSPVIQSQVRPAAPKSDIAPPQTVEKLTFYEQVKEQINGLFASYERFDRLETLIPSSKWVKVSYDESGKYYVVGLIGKPDFLCYGVPAVYSAAPPKALDGYCTWVPTEPTSPKGEGFWLMYQDAVTGESIGNL